jgi:hypothetical protein
MIANVQNLLDGMLQDRSWREPDQLYRRIDMLDQLDSLLVHHGAALERPLRHRSEALMRELEAINRELYQSIREDIQRGHGASRLLPWVATVPEASDGERYDPLDVLVSGVLDFLEPGDVPEPEAEMVFYQPTPARHVFDFMARASIGADDTVIDLGAGLGHVVLLTAICTPARCIGVELQSAYVSSARQCAQALNLQRASFLQQDVRHACLSSGTVFYLYTPFTGSVLQTVLGMLSREAERRAIRVCTLGSCTAAVAGEAWLTSDDACDPNHVAVFRSR